MRYVQEKFLDQIMQRTPFKKHDMCGFFVIFYSEEDAKEEMKDIEKEIGLSDE